MNNSEIHRLCKEYGIENYTINDGLVDVGGVVDLDGMDSINGSLPVKFGFIDGHFSCKRMGLTNLIGSPEVIWGWFDCRDNILTSLEGSPEEISAWFDCRKNNLTDLKGSPHMVNSHFNVGYNPLKTNYCETIIGGGFQTTFKEEGLEFTEKNYNNEAINYFSWRTNKKKLMNRKERIGKILNL